MRTYFKQLPVKADFSHLSYLIETTPLKYVVKDKKRPSISKNTPNLHIPLFLQGGVQASLQKPHPSFLPIPIKRQLFHGPQTPFYF